jgi:Dimerisation domain
MTPFEERSSVRLHRLINGYQVSQALYVAATLGIADLLRDGPHSFHCLENPMTSRQDPPHNSDDMASRLSQMIIGYRVSQALYVAAKLGIADSLHEGPKSCEALATATGVHPDALYRVLRALASVGVFTEVEPGRFGLTPLAPVGRAAVQCAHRAPRVRACVWDTALCVPVPASRRGPHLSSRHGRGHSPDRPGRGRGL